MAASAAPLASYPTKVDRWLLALVVAGLVGALAPVVIVAALERSPMEIAASALFSLAIVALVAALSMPRRYELHSRELVVRSGLLRYRVAYEDLVTLEPSSIILSSPA